MTWYRVLGDKRVPLRLLVFGVIALTPLGLVGRLDAKPDAGLVLPKGATLVSEHRYRSPMGYSETIRWLARRWSSKSDRVSFRTVVDRPGVVAAHAKPKSLPSRFWGVNVSRIGGRVEILFIE